MSKKKKRLSVEDHGNGYMVLGTTNIHSAAIELEDYVDNIEDYRFAQPKWYQGQKAVWLTTGPADFFDGALDTIGNPLPR